MNIKKIYLNGRRTAYFLLSAVFFAEANVLQWGVRAIVEEKKTIKAGQNSYNPFTFRRFQVRSMAVQRALCQKVAVTQTRMPILPVYILCTARCLYIDVSTHKV